MFLEIDEEKVKILSEIVQISGAKIVLSSTHRSDWRDGPENFWFSKSKALLYLFNKYNIEVVGITPYLDNPLGAPREEEIKTYLFQHPEVESFCIFDDDIKDLQTLKEYLIKTEFYANEIDEGGLQKRHIAEAVKLLSKKRTIFNK